MVLYLVGLGLGDEKDITVKGLETVRKCTKLFLEHYTSILGIDIPALEAFYGRKITLADRGMVESSAENIYGSAVEEDVALLVVGDPLCATTHTDIMLRARELGAKVEVIHNASVMGAAASCGLQLYSFGQTVSIPFFDGAWRPDSFYDKIMYNKGGDMHTLCLLDIKVKEPDFQAMMQNRTRFLPPRYMTVNTAVEQLLEVEEKRRAGVCADDVMAVGLARLGQPSQYIVAGTLRQLLDVDFGGPLHSLVICGALHDLEKDFLEPFRVENHPEATLHRRHHGGGGKQQDLASGNEGGKARAAGAAEATAAARAEKQEPGLDRGSEAPSRFRRDGGLEKAVSVLDTPPQTASKHELDDEDLLELCGLDAGDLQIAVEEEGE